MKSPMAGPQHEEKNMRLISKADLQRRTNRELAGMKEDIRKELGNCDQHRRKMQAAMAAVRTVQGQRRTMRPNL
jgi:hypothetical protein